MGNKWTDPIAVLLASAFAVSLAACASSDGNAGGTTPSAGGSATSAASTGAGTANRGTVTIDFALSMSSKDSAFASEALLKQFEAETNIHVNLQLLPADQATMLLQKKLAAGEAPDLVLNNLTSAVHDLNLERNFEALDDQPWVGRLLNKNVLSAYGRVYSFHVSQDTGMQGVVYNKDIFSDLGIAIPKNYDELVAAAQKIKAQGITPIFMPFKDTWATNIWMGAAFADYASKNDPTLWDDLNANKKKWTDTPALVGIIDQQYRLYKMGLTNPDILSDSYDMAVGKFVNKEIAMMFMGDWLIQDVENKDPNVHLGLFPIPYADDAKMGASPLGGQLFIPKKAKHLAEAKRFLNFLASKDIAQNIVTTNKYVSNFNDVTTPKLPTYKKEIVDRYMTPNKTVITSDAYMLVDLAGQYQDYQDVFAGLKTPEAALQAWDKQFTELMKAKGVAGF